jgi:hypothetical protein
LKQKNILENNHYHIIYIYIYIYNLNCLDIRKNLILPAACVDVYYCKIIMGGCIPILAPNPRGSTTSPGHNELSNEERPEINHLGTCGI